MSLETPRKGEMPQNHTVETISKLNDMAQFRQEVRESFSKRADALMNLLDALSSNTSAKSVAELSLNPSFGYQYPSVYDAIGNFLTFDDPNRADEQRGDKEKELMRLSLPYLPNPQERKFRLFALDVTPSARPFARTLQDRTIVYQPNPTASNKPITYGHQYAALVYLPEKTEYRQPAWVVPLSIRRVKSDQKATLVQAQQIATLIEAETKSNQLSVSVVDSSLSAIGFLGAVVENKNWITIARVRCNRVFYFPAETTESKRGHPTWYGSKFDLKDSATWTKPNLTQRLTSCTRRGQKLSVTIQAWNNLLMRGTRDFPMHQYPFTLVRITVRDPNGKLLFARPLWLIVIGQRRDELSLEQIFHAYRQRYDVEHFFRFGKQRLLTSSYQTPDVEHEENWWQITQLAYVQLFLVKDLANQLPKPWERFLPQFTEGGSASPSIVQRDFARIIRTIEPMAQSPKPRGKSPGRVKGDAQKRRQRQKVIKKSQKSFKSAA